MATGPMRARAGNLTAALVAVAFLELLLNRLANRLFLPRSTVSGEGLGSPAARVLSDSGPFLFHLTGVLALVVLAWTLVGLLKRGELFPRATRFTVTVIALVFWLLGALAVLFGHVPPRFFLHLETSFAFLCLLIGASMLGSRTQRRVKAGVMLFVLPGVLHVLAVVADRAGWLQGAALGAAEITRAGELLLLLACLAAPLLLPPRPVRERSWRLPLAAAAVVTAALVLLLALRYDLVQASALYGLRLEIPRPDGVLGFAYVLACFGWVYAAVQLVTDKGGMRLAGYGLLLLALAGYQAASSVELGLSLLGLLALAVGELRAAPYGEAGQPRIGSAEWRAFIGRLATAAGDGTGPDDTPPEAVVVEEGDLEASRLRAHRRGRPVGMRLTRRRGTLVELEMTYGQPGHGGPDASIERHRSWLARSPAERVRLPRVRTGDAAFDQKFSVHGQAPLGDGELRRRLVRQQGDAVVALWNGAAARYHLATGTAGAARDAEAPAPFAGRVDGADAVNGIIEMLDTLADLVEASTPVGARAD